MRRQHLPLTVLPFVSAPFVLVIMKLQPYHHNYNSFTRSAPNRPPFIIMLFVRQFLWQGAECRSLFSNKQLRPIQNPLHVKLCGTHKQVGNLGVKKTKQTPQRATGARARARLSRFCFGLLISAVLNLIPGRECLCLPPAQGVNVLRRRMKQPLCRRVISVRSSNDQTT